MTDTKSKTLWEALFEFQEKCPPIGFDNEGRVGTRTYGYATLPAILRKIRPTLKECGLIVVQSVTVNSVVTSVRFGQEVVLCEVALTDSPDMQKMGSAITYARRYGLTCALGIAPDEDDDGASTVTDNAPARKAASAAHTEATKVKIPEGWTSDEEPVERHNSLTARILKLPEEYQAQMVLYRTEHGWPLAKDKFLDLAAMVLTAENFDGAGD